MKLRREAPLRRDAESPGRGLFSVRSAREAPTGPAQAVALPTPSSRSDMSKFTVKDTALRGTLLPKLFSGELHVPEMPL